MMKNTMMYKGYAARVEYDPRDEIFVGRVLGIVDSVTFHGSSVDELASDFHAAIDQYLADCAATGRKPEPPPPASQALLTSS
jgi:predicted HicB family RNase H-like nuclease